MSTFKVVNIINANTIQVSPKWVYKGSEDLEIIDDVVKISDLNVEFDNEYAKHRLHSLLQDKSVDLVNPVFLSKDESPHISCTVLIDKTDITYYFPEFKNLVMA